VDYNPNDEEKWQQTWAELGLDDSHKYRIPYALPMFPYPSVLAHGSQIRKLRTTDVIARPAGCKVSEYCTVMDGDAFGHSHALDRGISGKVIIKKYRSDARQLRRLGLSID